METELVDLFSVVHCRWWVGVSDDYDELHRGEREALDDDLWVAGSRLFNLAASRRSDGPERTPA